MILLTIRMKVSQSNQADFLETIRSVIGPTNAQPGCISCHLYQDSVQENAFILVEEWDSREQLDRHMRAPMFRTVLSSLELLDDFPDIKVNTVSHSAGMEAIKTARARRPDRRKTTRRIVRRPFRRPAAPPGSNGTGPGISISPVVDGGLGCGFETR